MAVCRWCMAFIIGLVAPLASLRADEASAKDIARLIAQLGSNDFQRRVQATNKLDAIGPAALDALKRAVRSSDVETQRRAMELIRRIERRQETSRLLEASKLSVEFRETDLPKAVAEIARKSGQTIVLQGKPSQWVSRRVTFKASNEEFWPLLDRFCKQAGLQERIEQSVALTGTRPVPQTIPYSSKNKGLSQRIVLGLGQSKWPTIYFGAARVRLLPALATGHGTVKLRLAVSFEGGVQLQRLQEVANVEATDDQGKPLEVVPADKTTSNAPVFLENTGGRPVGVVSTLGQHELPVFLKTSNRSVKELQKVSGTVSAVVRTKPEPLMTIENILKSTGKSVRGKSGGKLTILEVERQTNGMIRLRVELHPTVDTNAPGANGRFPQIQPNQILRWTGSPTGYGNNLGLSLVDSSNKPFQLVSTPSRRTSVDNSGVSYDATMYFKPGKDQKTPARLVYSNSRSATVEIPFSWNGIPLR